MNQDIYPDFVLAVLCIKTYGDCHQNSKFVYDELKKQGYDISLVRGVYVNLPKIIQHSWIEYDDMILETDIKQLREPGDILPDEDLSILPKNKFKNRYIPLSYFEKKIEQYSQNELLELINQWKEGE
jgi:hypothetical protein